MRLSKYLTTVEREEKVLKIIQDLGLNYCADTPLNLVSGGERKRTSVGLEIISDPVLLLLDEATSGKSLLLVANRIQYKSNDNYVSNL
jgi:ABC-type multidrug transport system ATPase subunit